MTVTGDAGAIALGQKILALLDEGAFTATYKYAVLLGLLDLSIEYTDAKGEPPQAVTTRQLTEKVVQLYWLHTRPYAASGRSPRVLRQNAGRSAAQAKIVRLIEQFRDCGLADPDVSLAAASCAVPTAFARLLDRVEWVLIEMPLGKVQRFGGMEDRFLYDIGWDDRRQLPRREQVRRYQLGLRSGFDNTIRFLPGVAAALIRLNPLLRPLLHRLWAAKVAALNDLEEARLEEFLFGTTRKSLAPLRRGLLDLQDGRCFYCERPIRSASEVDHFIPWKRFPENRIENLVVADHGCNGDKRDHLAAIHHIVRWKWRLEATPELAALAREKDWASDPEVVRGVALALYLRLGAGVPLWVRGSEFEVSEPQALREVLVDRLRGRAL